MSIRRNIFSNYVSQGYVTLVGIIMVPLYIRHMGPEAYGLVGFFAMLQVWFNLLDLGLTPTIARETARFHAGAMDALSFRRLVRALEGVFLLVAVAGTAALMAASTTIASEWLQAARLPVSEVQSSVQLMAAIVALRWMCGLYRGIVSGSERLVWLGAYNASIATLRSVPVLAVLMYVSATPTAFFSFQFGVAALELGGLTFFAYRLLPGVSPEQQPPWQWSPLKPVLKFSATIAFTSLAWALVTETDKLVLSRILPLADYGYFSAAVLVASGIIILSAPISSAILPRMARLHAEGKHSELINVYRNATQLVAVVAAPAALVLAVFAKQALWAWTGDVTLVEKAAPVLTLYAAGYGILAISTFPYFLQYATGNLKLHFIGSALMAILLVPLLIWAAMNYGMTGAGWAWLISNSVYFMVWVPLVHMRLVKGLHSTWLITDIGIICIPVLAFALLMDRFLQWGGNRLETTISLCAIGFVMLMAAGLFSSSIREFVVRKVR